MNILKYHLHKIKFDINLAIRLNTSYCKFKYNSEIEENLNEQIRNEHQAAMNYLDMAVNFLHPCVSYTGTGGYFMKMYREELHHMEILIDYQLTRGGTPLLSRMNQGAKSIKANITLIDAFNQALEMEKDITEKLEKIISKAEELKDYHCADFITSKFLKEQMHSVNELSHHVTVVNRFCGNDHALYHYDQHLRQSYPFSFKNNIN